MKVYVFLLDCYIRFFSVDKGRTLYWSRLLQADEKEKDKAKEKETEENKEKEGK